MCRALESAANPPSKRHEIFNAGLYHERGKRFRYWLSQRRNHSPQTHQGTKLLRFSCFVPSCLCGETLPLATSINHDRGKAPEKNIRQPRWGGVATTALLCPTNFSLSRTWLSKCDGIDKL